MADDSPKSVGNGVLGHLPPLPRRALSNSFLAMEQASRQREGLPLLTDADIEALKAGRPMSWESGDAASAPVTTGPHPLRRQRLPRRHRQPQFRLRLRLRLRPRPVLTSASKSQNGLRPERSGVNPPSQRNRQGAVAAVYRHSMMPKSLPCWANQSPRRRPLRLLLNRRRQPQPLQPLLRDRRQQLRPLRLDRRRQP